MGVDVGDAPVTVRLAGAAVAVQGLAVLAAGGVLLVSAGAPFGVWGFFGLLGAALLALGGALVAGRPGARSPTIVLQILALGVAYYATVPSNRPEWGVPLLVVAAGILAGLLGARARAWADT